MKRLAPFVTESEYAKKYFTNGDKCGECHLWFYPQEAINHAPNKARTGRKASVRRKSSKSVVALRW